MEGVCRDGSRGSFVRPVVALPGSREVRTAELRASLSLSRLGSTGTSLGSGTMIATSGPSALWAIGRRRPLRRALRVVRPRAAAQNTRLAGKLKPMACGQTPPVTSKETASFDMLDDGTGDGGLGESCCVQGVCNPCHLSCPFVTALSQTIAWDRPDGGPCDVRVRLVL